MDRKVIIRSESELRSIEIAIFDCLQDNIHIHLLPIGHHCSDNEAYTTFTHNNHPSMKCIFLTHQIYHAEIEALNIVLRANFGHQLEAWCPNCGDKYLNN